MISVIFPVYNEQDNLIELYNRLNDVTSYLNNTFEFVFVDDCSSDQTPFILKDLHQKDERVQYITFSRNSGSHSAITAGLLHCRGEAAIVLAADLQDPPEISPQLLDKWQEDVDVVWGVRERREGQDVLSLTLARFYYFIVNKLTDVRRPPTGADIVLINRNVIEAYRGSFEKSGSAFIIISWIGFNQVNINYVKKGRFDSLISFSYLPLRFMSVTGFFFAHLGLTYSMVVFFRAIGGIPIQGWSSLMISVLVLGGIQLLMMGLLGEYLW